MRHCLYIAALWLFSSLFSVCWAQTPPTYADRLMVEMAKAVVQSQENPKMDHLNELSGLKTWEDVKERKSTVWMPNGKKAYYNDYAMLEKFYECLGVAASPDRAIQCYEKVKQSFLTSDKAKAERLTICWEIAQKELDKQPANEVLTEQTIAAPAFPEDKAVNTNAVRSYENEEGTTQGLWTQLAFWIGIILSITTSVAIAYILIRNKFEETKEYVRGKISKIQPNQPALQGGGATSAPSKNEFQQLKNELKTEQERNNKLEETVKGLSQKLEQMQREKATPESSTTAVLPKEEEKTLVSVPVPAPAAKRYYISSPDGNKFNDANKNEHSGPFLLIEQNANRAEYGVNAENTKFWNNLRQGYLSSEYVFDIFPDSCPIDRAQSIVRQEYGMLERQGNNWVIVRKAKVCFN